MLRNPSAAWPSLTLREAEDQLADAKTNLDAEMKRSRTGNEPALLQAEDAFITARVRFHSVLSQQPTNGRAFHDEVDL